MSFIFKTNVVTDRVNKNFFLEFKNFMISPSPDGPGWTVKLSSNTISFGSNDYLSTVADLLYTNSWIVLQDPSGNREFLFQHTGSSGIDLGTKFNIKYSASSGFSGGGLTTPPTAVDEKNILYNSTGVRWALDSYDRIIISQMGADDSGEYPFFIFSYSVDYNRRVGGGLYMDSTTSLINDVIDEDPVVIYVCPGGAYSIYDGFVSSFTDAGINFKTWQYKNTPKESFIYTSLVGYGGNGGWTYNNDANRVPGNSFQNDEGKYFLFPVIYGYNMTNLKGKSNNFKYNPEYYEKKNILTLFSESTSGDLIAFNDLVFPWNGDKPL
jgi:hypothetical protein